MPQSTTMTVSPLQDLLGRLSEKYPRFLLKLGRLESRCLRRRLAEVRIDRPIFICGLARSGTTVLLELLAGHRDTATHRYRDFPLIQIPAWWNWFLDHAGAGTQAAVERAHRDRIMVTPDSPEAMEESLWMAFFAECHNPAVTNVLDGRRSFPDFESFYREHIRKILLLRGGCRYLAKNNYSISRLGYLRRLFPDALFLVPVRNPVSHVASLAKQHRLFCVEERRDTKVLDYMRRAGHFEFGLDRRAVNFGDRAATERIRELWRTGREQQGLAALWSSAYSFVAGLLEENAALSTRTLIVHYDDLCAETERVLRRVYGHCGLEIDEETLRARASRLSPPAYYEHGFSDADLQAIRAETCATEERIRLLIESQPPV